MKLVPYEAGHFERLQLSAAERAAVALASPDLAMQMDFAHTMSIVDGDEVLVCGGVLTIWRNRGLLFSFVSDAIGPHRWIGVHRLVTQFIEEACCHRLEAEVRREFKAGHRWMHMLGFQVERECAKAYYPDGADATLYVRFS